MAQEVDPEQLDFGTKVYDQHGRELGKIRGVDDNGFYVTLREGINGLSSEHVSSTGAWGEAELEWRCWNCGEMGTIDDELPETCPNCGNPKEDLYYWTED